MAIADAPKPFVIPIFIPHAGCPHRCIFCDQTRTTNRSEALPTTAQLDETIQRFLSYRQDAQRYTEISFYGGNFLGLPLDHILFFLESVSKHISEKKIQGIRFSTRPDTITPQRLDLLAQFPVSTVELGVQTMNDDVLRASGRGHSVQDIHDAVGLLKTGSYRLGLQMMVGLPGDTEETAMTTGKRVADLAPDFVRIYPTLVLAGSRLESWYQQDRYSPLTLEDAVALTKRLYMLFVSHRIKVIRMGLQATEGLYSGADLVAGPFHPAFGELVHSAMWLDIMRKEIQSMDLKRHQALIVELHPKLISRIKGHKKKNMAFLSREFSLLKIDFSTNNRLPLDIIQMNGKICRLFNYN
jgi:histone acetyltransferase (RNA polymerase elongator complex component)